MASAHTPRTKPFVRRVSYLISLVMVAGLIGSSTSCAQILGVNKDYKKGSFAPAGWYCTPAQYNEIGNGADPTEAFCDCVCGAYDPDCDEDFDEDISGIADHTNEDDEPDGIIDSSSCKVCLEDDNEKSKVGSVCAASR